MSLSVDIEKKLGDFHLKVRFEAENEVLALLGASGCGKSMTLKCISGIEKPDRGCIILDGRTLFDSEKHIDLPPQKRRVGYLFQQYALFPNMTVEQNIACGVRNGKNKHGKISEIIKMMHLEGVEKQRPHQLSGGQQQRAALARILVNDPDILLLDEPFSALDSHLRFRLEQEVRDVIRRFGKTVLLVSHDRDEVFRLSDSIAVVNNGQIEAIGKKHAVFANPETTTGASLTGCKNISPVSIVDDTHVIALDWGMTLEVSNTRDISHVGVRMHDICIGGGENSAVCRVVSEIENPFSYTVMLMAPGGTVPFGIELPKEQWRQEKSDEITVSMPQQSIILLKG